MSSNRLLNSITVDVEEYFHAKNLQRGVATLTVEELYSRVEYSTHRCLELFAKQQVKGTVDTQYEKDRLRDKIKSIGGENPSDIMADIKVANTSYYTKHTVEKGESLSKISKHYYGDPMQYNRIFQANTDILKDPNMIYPGQELTIPYPEGHKPGM